MQHNRPKAQSNLFMRYVALAADYDGTLASGGRVDQPTLDSQRRLVDSGRKLVMVTGRQLDDLHGVLSRVLSYSAA